MSLSRWLAGRTLSARLIAGLLALFLLASLGVGIATTAALSRFLLDRLDQQLNTAAAGLSFSIEHPQGPAAGGGASSGSCADQGLAFGQSIETFAARLKGGRITAACVVTGGGGRPGLRAVHLAVADVRALERLPVARPDQLSQPQTVHLSGLGDYRLSAFAGRDGDVHVAGLPLAGIQATLRRLELIEVVVFGTALIVMALAATGWVRFSLRPLERITATASRVSDLPLASGEVDLPHRVPEADPRTETGRLGRALNQMLGHVEAALAARQASEARLRRFVADASHELRTPLAGIRGHAELALRTGDLGPEARAALGRVEAESQRMSRLVDDLLLLARLDAGRPLAREPVDLSRLAIDATSDARVAGPGHRWVLDLPTEPVTVEGDQYRLHQVMANLLSNARNHTPPGTTVTVRLAGSADGGAELSVTDDGPGIPADRQDGVWERFARGDGSRSRKAGGTGLGLAIVRAVVNAQHGRIVLASEPGQTSFRIWLPTASGPAG